MTQQPVLSEKTRAAVRNKELGLRPQTPAGPFPFRLCLQSLMRGALGPRRLTWPVRFLAHAD